MEERRIRGGKRRALPQDAGRTAQCAARARRQSITVHTVLVAEAGDADSAAQRFREYAAYLSFAADRSGKCSFRVGNDVREWVEGKAWLFDDTIEHEAWNHSDQTRVILLFDVWRPELTGEERSLVVSLFEAIDAHEGKKPEWSI